MDERVQVFEGFDERGRPVIWDSAAATEHGAEPITDARGALVCGRCGGAVRQWPDGRFPIHAEPRPRKVPPTCVCGHALSSHRQDAVDPYISERCKACGCAAFDNRDDARMQGEDE